MYLSHAPPREGGSRSAVGRGPRLPQQRSQQGRQNDKGEGEEGNIGTNTAEAAGGEHAQEGGRQVRDHSTTKVRNLVLAPPRFSDRHCLDHP